MIPFECCLCLEYGIWCPKTICLWNMVSQNHLSLEYGVPKLFVSGIWCPKTICLWNMVSQNYLSLDYGVPKRQLLDCDLKETSVLFFGCLETQYIKRCLFNSTINLTLIVLGVGGQYPSLILPVMTNTNSKENE